MKLKFKKKIALLLIVSLLLPNFSLAQEETKIPSKIAKAPETIGEAKEWLRNLWQKFKETLPGALKKILQEEVFPVWQKMWEWFRVNAWVNIKGLFQEEIEKRKPLIEKELEKEKGELKKEVPKIGKPLWDRFKELIK